MGVERPERGALPLYHSTSRPVHYTQTPNRRIRNRIESSSAAGPTGDDVYCVSNKNRPPQQLGQWETIISLNSCLSPMDVCLKQPLPTFPLLLHKITFLSFVGRRCRFCHSPFVPNCDSLLILKQPTFAGKITVLFLKSTAENSRWVNKPRQHAKEVRAMRYPRGMRFFFRKTSTHRNKDSHILQSSLNWLQGSSHPTFHLTEKEKAVKSKNYFGVRHL